MKLGYNTYWAKASKVRSRILSRVGLSMCVDSADVTYPSTITLVARSVKMLLRIKTDLQSHMPAGKTKDTSKILDDRR